MLHAYRNPVDAYDLDDGVTMLVGADRAGRLLEVGIVARYDRDVIIHAMTARPQYLR
jgi:hypothetical protein